MPSQLFLDTSVLLNYVQVWLEGDDGSVAVIEGDYDRFICKTVKKELETRCSTRRQIYMDLRKFVEQEDHSEVHPVFNYKVLDFENQNPSVPVTDNDRDHLRDLQMEFSSIDDDDKFYKLRKFIRSVKSRKKAVDGKVTVYSGSHKSDLVDEINSHIDNRQDSLVLAQGVTWHDDNNGDTVVALDYKDMINREEDINEAIKLHYTPDHQLNVTSPDEV